MHILMVLTSHDQLGQSGVKTGFWLEEFAAPYYVFQDAGAYVTLASPLGGRPPLDPKSDLPDAETSATRRFKADPVAQAALAHTAKLGSVRPAPSMRPFTLAAMARCGILQKTPTRSR